MTIGTGLRVMGVSVNPASEEAGDSKHSNCRCPGGGLSEPSLRRGRRLVPGAHMCASTPVSVNPASEEAGDIILALLASTLLSSQ